MCAAAGEEAPAKADAAAEMKEESSVSDESGKEDASDDAGGLYDYEEPSAEEESYPWLVFKTIIVLGALVGGFYYFFRFVTRKTGINAIGQDVIKVLSIVPVGQNKFLQVVDIAGRILILGVSDSNINLITEVCSRDEIDRIRLLSSKSSPVQPGGFQQYISKNLNKILNRVSGKTENEADSAPEEEEKKSADRMNYLKKQKDRLRGLNGTDDKS